MRTLTLLNQKGGVGKTSTCHHLAGALSKKGRRVLLIDNDPQSSLTQGLIGPLEARNLHPTQTVAEIYASLGDTFPELLVRATTINGVDLIAGHRDATGYNLPYPFRLDHELQRSISSFLQQVRDYDFCLIDCPPNLHLCSWASLVGSTHIIVPLQAEDYGAQGIIDVQDSVEMVRGGPNPSLEMLGYLITMFSPRKSIHKLYSENLRDLYGEEVFKTIIPHAADYPEAIAARKPVSIHKPRGAAAKAFDSLADEIEARVVAVPTATRGVA